MKKHFLITLALIIAVLSFSSCGHEHAWSEWTTVTDATCTIEGVQERVCECGEKETQQIAAKGHTPDEISCTTAQICTVCSAELSAAPGHKEEWVVVKPATKNESGSEAKKCTVCGQKSDERIILATGSLGLSYTVNADGKTCTITGIGTCTDSEVSIPEVYEGYTVTAIASRAFYQCNTITSVKIPSSVQTIGSQVFFKASNLETVYYNGDCQADDNPFANTSVEKIVFSGTKIPAQICKELTSIREIVIEDSVIHIGTEAFYRSNVSSITFGNGVKTIGDSAFFGCKGLTDVTLSNSVTTIGEKAFGECTRLTNITIPTSVTSIGQEAFTFCVKLKSLVIPDSITEIASKTFYACAELTNVTIPDSVTSIAEEAFATCTSLTYVCIPDSVTEIGENAFTYCTSLTNIQFGGTAIEWYYDVRKENLGSYIPAQKITCSDGEISLD